MCSTIALFLILMWQTYFIQQSFAGCEDNTCAPNSTCIKIPSKANSTGKMISTQGSIGDGGKHCYGYCMPTSVGLDGSSLTFNGTYDGDLAFSNEMCVYGYPVALATCATTRSNNGDYMTSFLSEFVTNCTYKNLTQIFKDLSHVDDIINHAVIMTRGLETINTADVRHLLEFFDRVLSHKLAVCEKNFKKLVLTLSQLIEWLKTYDHEDPNTSNNRLHLTEILNKACATVALEDSSMIYAHSFNLIVQLNNVNESTEDLEFLPVVYDDYESNPIYPVQVILPSKARLINGTHPSKRVWFILHRDNTLFSQTYQINWIVSVGIGEPYGQVYSVSDSLTIRYLTTEMSFGKQSLDVFTDKLLQGYCKNWNAHYQKWVLEGCCLNQNSDYPECLCGRVGDFVLFVESEEVRAVFAISIIVYIGTTLKFIGYFITFIILISFRVLRQQTQYKVLANIFFCLFTTYLIFILGIDQRLKPIVCGFIAGLLHYFLLACFSWFAVMAKLLYGAFVTVLGSHIHCFLPKACLFAYVLPLIPAAITAGITLGVGESISSTLCVHDPGNAESVVSRYVDDRECLIKGYSLYFGLLLPIAVILLYNWICFVMILQKIVCRKDKVQSSTPQRTMKQHLLMVSTLSILLGLDSTVTYLMVIAENEIYSTTMRVVFVILSTIQGVAVVYFVCINNAEVKNAWCSSVKKKFNYFSNVCCLKQIKKSKTQDDQVTADRPIELLTFQT